MRTVLLALMLLAPATLAAQEKRGGPEFAVGAGFGHLRSYYEYAPPGSEEAESYVVKGGAETLFARGLFPVSRKVLLGLEAYYGGGGEEGRRVQDFGGMLAFRWAPNLDRGITVRGGYGIVYSDIEPVTAEGQEIDGDLTGMLVSFGIGWTFPIGQRWALEPMLRADIAPVGSFQATEEIIFRNIINTRYSVGVSLVWH